MVQLDKNGHEIPSQETSRMPLTMKRPETLTEQVQRLVRTSVSAYAANQGDETFEESEDFDIGDDFDPSTPYETYFDPVLQKELTPVEFKANQSRYREEYLKKEQLNQKYNDDREARRSKYNQQFPKKAPSGASEGSSSSSTSAEQTSSSSKT